MQTIIQVISGKMSLMFNWPPKETANFIVGSINLDVKTLSWLRTKFGLKR